MMTIYKYPLKSKYEAVTMPEGATILTLQLQNEIPTIWALVDNGKPLVTRNFGIIATGYDFHSDNTRYIGTVQQANGLVWHVLELVKPTA